MEAGLLAFTVALVASLGLTVPVRQLALRVGMVDRPGPRKVHLQPIPLLGGIAIYSGVLLAMAVSFVGGEAIIQILGILAGATLVVLVGTLDDRGLLHHQVKLFIAMPVAGLILLASGIRAQVFSVYFHGWGGAVADAVLTIFWVTAITASFSIFDHMDGLCAGVAAIASLFFAIFALLSGQVLVSTLAAAVMGAALGFLRWNFNPAKIFMGDGGAMFLGFLMATLALKLRMTEVSHAAGWLIPLFVLGVPIFDTTLVTISRSRRGLIPFTTPGKDHTAHRLSNWGLGTRRAVLALYTLGGIFGLLALAVSRLSSWTAVEVAAGTVAIVLAGVALLERAPYERQQRKPKSA
jgi:UDP-GlcNAc:undecaprenyl-phosphate/decaprenyl-phosphate GlcNAc-1-phosphate transferase